jgi:hypothetical protein
MCTKLDMGSWLCVLRINMTKLNSLVWATWLYESHSHRNSYTFHGGSEGLLFMRKREGSTTASKTLVNVRFNVQKQATVGPELSYNRKPLINEDDLRKRKAEQYIILKILKSHQVKDSLYKWLTTSFKYLHDFYRRYF